LRGNRFRILIREAADYAAERLPPLLDRLRTLGLPNYYGPQRFGHEGETVRLGMARLRGERTRRLSTFLFKLALSAAQSGLFNHYLARRIADGLFRTVLSGDVMAKWLFGGCSWPRTPREQRGSMPVRRFTPDRCSAARRSPHRARQRNARRRC
jgi:tRNA pseudouridine13 synthase